MASYDDSPTRTRAFNKLVYVEKWNSEKECYLLEDQFILGTVKSEKELVKKIYDKNGAGRYSVKLMSPKITGLWTGWIEDRGKEL